LERIVTVPLGVVISREAIDHPWQECIWRPVSVFLDAAPVTAWRTLRTDGRVEHFHAATLPLELHRKETAGYIANLTSQAPGIYVILREGAADGGSEPVHVHLLTASGHEIEAYGHGPSEIVGCVAIPDELRALIEAFVAAHHVDEPFEKRQRRPHVDDDDVRQFGQEPIDVLRSRMKRAGKDLSDL
jgi:hypothetical protein